MVNSYEFHRSASWLTLVSVFVSLAAVHVADAKGQYQCPSFSCGGLHNIWYPFRRPGDPPECGVQSYELVCSSTKATIRINTGTYFVTSINYTDKSFWVVDANLDVHSSCPLPRMDQLPYRSYWKIGSPYGSELATATDCWVCFVNCSQAVTEISWYKPVTCLSTNSSFVYISLGFLSCTVDSLIPSCGYLAAIPLGSFYYSYPENASYAEIIELVKKGFSVSFPTDSLERSLNSNLKSCLNDTKRFFHEHLSSASPLNWTIAFFVSYLYAYRSGLILSVAHPE